jgi:hypothetical protein
MMNEIVRADGSSQPAVQVAWIWATVPRSGRAPQPARKRLPIIYKPLFRLDRLGQWPAVEQLHSE